MEEQAAYTSLLVDQWERATVSAPMRKLAIVGSHPDTRQNAPYEDPEYEIWLFNEAAQKPEIYRRWDAIFQLHKPEVYTSLNNWVNKDHWAWLQSDHGADKRIWMQEYDERVPNSVKYPLEEVLKLVPYHYLRSTPAEALALAIYLGYKDISLYGSDLTSNTEYHYQAINMAFWIGFAHGYGVDFHLECWKSEFWQPIYGYEGEAQIDREYFEKRLADAMTIYRINELTMRKTQSRMEDAMLKNEYQKVGEISLQLEETARATGEAFGVKSEAERYIAKVDPISRQEFERVSAKAQKDGPNAEKRMNHAGGKAEYVWNIWLSYGKIEALNQLRAFLKEKTDAAFEYGRLLGVFRENATYMHEYDDRVTALGGKRALHHLEEPKE
jgi:hypothetical protein